LVGSDLTALLTQIRSCCTFCQSTPKLQVDFGGKNWLSNYKLTLLVHGQVTIIFVVSVCLSACLFVCAEFF